MSILHRPVMNIGDVYTPGPEGAAWAIDTPIDPREVIAFHANGAVTKDGKSIAGTKTGMCVRSFKTPAHIPSSGKTTAFVADGSCVGGCD